MESHDEQDEKGTPVMSDTLDGLMEKNLIEVFGQRDFSRREAAIAEIYTEDCTFFEADEQIVGRDALNAKIGRILQEAPGYVFRATGPAQLNHNLGRLQWRFGPAGAPPVVTGMDVAVFEHGRIRACTPFSTSLRVIEEARPLTPRLTWRAREARNASP
jgi:hypothetical protein